MSKPFKTHNQMLKILRNRGVFIKNGSKVKRILERENYYCIINGYKDLFLVDKNLNPDLYRNGTEFDEIFQLFSLDRELKNLFMSELIKIESLMKSLVSYHFHNKHKEKNSFLAFENFTQDPSKTREVLSVIASLSNKISKQKHNAVTYYIEKYQHCPLWVLVNFLTFGEVSKLYKVCENDVRLTLAKEISKHYKNQYKTNIHISSEMIDECLGTFVMYRNVCAHDERLYNYKARFSEGALNRALSTNLLNRKNLFSILILIKLFIKKSDYKIFIKKYKTIFDKYDYRFKTIDIQDIKHITGYDVSWITNNLQR